MSNLSLWHRPSEELDWPSFGRFGDLRSEMQRVFDRFASDLPSLARFEEGTWVPKMDLTETPEAYHLRAELPNMESKDVDVRFEDNILTVSGEKKKEEKKEAENYLCLERTYGAFTRSFRIPKTVKEDKIVAACKNGVLAVTLPKTEEQKTKSKKIPVTT